MSKAQKKNKKNVQKGQQSPVSGEIPPPPPARSQETAETREAEGGPAPQSPPTYCYVDIAGVRIQTWLGRTARIRGRRGASYALAELTSSKSIQACLSQREFPDAPDLKWNPETGEVSGVASLRFTVQENTDPMATARAIATTVAQSIHEKLPALSLNALAAQGKTYMSVCKHRELILDLPGASLAFPMARVCGACGQDAAVRRAQATSADESIAGRPDDVFCRDCYARHDAAGRASQAHVSKMPRSQAELIEMIEKRLRRTVAVPWTFEELARMGKHGADAATQLATIFADGNRIGALMDKLSSNPNADHSAVVRLLDATTKRALADAVQRITVPSEGDTLTKLPVIVHIAGGDDVAVSVPARFGWVFLHRLCTAFNEQARRADPDKSLQEALGEAPTLSAGMVFHHLTDPIDDVIHRAEGMLKLAKKRFRGREAAVAFLDLTYDGPDLAHGDDLTRPSEKERVFSLSQLDQHKELWTELANVPASQRSTLRQLVRECLDQSREDAGKELGRRIGVMSIPAVIKLASNGSDVAVPAALDRDQQVWIRTGLDVTRWWPKDFDGQVAP